MELYAIIVPKVLPPDIFDRLLSLLDAESQARIRRFRLEDDAIRSLFGRLSIIWYLITNHIITTTQVTELKFGVAGKGKPTIIKPHITPKVEYNISHDGEFVLLGVKRGGDVGVGVGVDIMSIPPHPDEIEEALTDQMTLNERRMLSLPLSPSERADRLMTIWCIKEAYVKAIGEGVGFGLDRIEVSLSSTGLLEGVSVDGQSVEDLGWRTHTGILERERPYRWACLNGMAPGVCGTEPVPRVVQYQDLIDVILP